MSMDTDRLSLQESRHLSDGDASNAPSPTARVADVRSVDGKYHRLVLDRGNKIIEFSIAGAGGRRHEKMVKDLNELICVRGTPIRMRRGLPVDLNKNARQVDTPNHLFFYFAEKKARRRWRIRTVVALFITTSEKKMWLDAVDAALHELPERPKSLLIFVNPYGGKGRAKKIYKYQVELILEMADIRCDVVMTQRANHAFDCLKQLEAAQWESIDGVVSVGGDGLFNECLSAIVCRAQVEANKDITDKDVDILITPRMRFGIIGAGSANSIVSSVHGTDDCPTAAIHIAMGSRCSVDVCTVHRGDDLMRISANAISYGWLGDVLAESERYRWMGPFRYQYSALCTTVRNPAYYGRVSFTLIPEVAQQTDPSTFPKCVGPCSLCAKGRTEDDSYSYHIQMDYTHIICCVMPCVSPFTPYGLAPYTGIGDGSMDLAVVPRIGRCANMSFMRKVAFCGPKSVLAAGNQVNVFRVTKWSFTPSSLLTNNEHKNEALGCWNLDGEILPQPADQPFHFRLHPRLITYFGREVDLNAPERKSVCCGKDYKKVSSIIRVPKKQ